MIFEGDKVKTVESSAKILGEITGEIIASNGQGHVKVKTNKGITDWMDENHFKKITE